MPIRNGDSFMLVKRIPNSRWELYTDQPMADWVAKERARQLANSYTGAIAVKIHFISDKTSTPDNET